MCLIGVAIFVNYTFREVINNRNISIQVKENDDEYQLKARYPKRKTNKVQHYVDNMLHTGNALSGGNIDAMIDVENLSVYVYTKPGYMILRLDKHRNDPEGYTRMKELERGLRYKLDE